MTEDPCQCDEFSDNLAELALGILTGRSRAATLAHVDSCAHCAEELEQLARAADAVVSVAPELEPAVGFEVRLFNRMGLAESPAPESRPRPWPIRWVAASPRWTLATAAAVIALAVGLSVGWSIHSSSTGRTTGTPVAEAALTLHGATVGNVATYGGPTPWMIVTLADSSAHGMLACEVVTANGVVHKVGTFSADYGYAAWDAQLRVAPQDVRKAEVVSSDGTVIATATLS
jgi:hypothetical protein